MTPKEKAQELVNKYHLYLRANLLYSEDAYEDSIQCALIAVDEILNELDDIMNFEGSKLSLKMIKYWEQVKQEIEKL